MSEAKVYRFRDYRAFLSELVARSPRGFQTKLASAMGCQGIYLSRALKGDAQLTEEQGFRGAKFLGMTVNETDFFLDLIRLARAGDHDYTEHLERRLNEKAEAHREVANRLGGKTLSTSLQTQVDYYGRWQPSVLHVATSCPDFRTDAKLSERFGIPLDEVRQVMEFLIEAGLVTTKDGKYEFSGASLHLQKGSTLHRVFQRGRRHLMSRALESPRKESLHFSTSFATSAAHAQSLREGLLEFIEKMHRELGTTESEDVHLMSIDFCRMP